MLKKIHLKIMTPEALIIDEYVDSVSMPTKEGEITVLPGHIPLISELSSGDIVASLDGEQIPHAVSGGFIEVKREDDGQTTLAILADFAEHVSTLTDDAITKAKEKAEELRRQKNNNEIVDFEHFETELERSLTRIKIADKWKTKKYRK